MHFPLYNLLFAFLIIFLGAGCSFISLPSLPSLPWPSSPSEPNPQAEALFKEGVDAFNNKKYALAIDRLQKVKSEFPFAPEVASAELKLAEAYYLNQQYPEAIAAFKEFQALHPTNENIPFVFYHLGLAHFDQFSSVDRDQKLTGIAKGYFETVVKDHPNSPYAAKAQEKLAQCLEYLAAHEFEIASFYLREKKYPAARDRFEEIIRRYNNTSVAPEALYQLGESYRLDKNGVKAALAYEALIQYYPDSPLAKTAQSQLADLAKEKQDPLAMLLKREGRPALAPAAEISRQTAEGSKPKELNLVAKKEVVHEEPGSEKGFLRRVADTLNPFSSADKTDKKEIGDKQAGSADTSDRKTESDGFFTSLWRGINPFASGQPEASRAEAAPDPQLVGKIDSSLKQRGIGVDAKSGTNELELKPPAADLSGIAEAPAPPPADPAVILGDLDAQLKKKGKEVGELPSPPEPAPVFKAVASEGKGPGSSKAEPSSPQDTSRAIANIDQALKRKGIDPAKIEEATKDQAKSAESQGAASPPQRAKREEKKIELAPRLGTEKGPFFLDPRELQAQDKPTESEEAGKATGLERSAPSSPPASQASEGLPEAVVKGPPQPAKEKPQEGPKVAPTKRADEEDEPPKGILDQLREDIEKVGKILNPLNW